MKKRWMTSVAASLLAVLGLTIGGCSSTEKPQDATPPAPTGTAVTVAVVQEGTLPNDQTFIGSITAKQTGSVYAQATGQLNKLYVHKGDTVKKGQVIGEIDNSRAVIDVRDAQAKLAEAKARLAQSQTAQSADAGQSATALAQQSLEKARESYERVKKLVEEGALPAAQLDDAEDAWIRAQSAYRSTNVSDARDMAGIKISSAVVEEAQINLEKAKKALSDTQIRAVMDGTIDSLSVSVGDVVTTQTPVAAIVSLDQVTANVQVAESHLRNVTTGKRVQVSIPALGVKQEGTVSYVGLTASPQGKLYPVEITLANPAHQLRPGMRADVTVIGSEKQRGIVVPIEALVQEDGKQYVFLVKEDRAIRREVAVLEANTTSALIGQGLSPSDTVVIAGQTDIQDNALVKMVHTKGEGE